MYLGSAITADGRQREDIEARKIGTAIAYELLLKNLWERTKVSLTTKMNICNAVVLTVLLYGATEEQQLDVFEMKLLRRMAKIR